MSNGPARGKYLTRSLAFSCLLFVLGAFSMLFIPSCEDEQPFRRAVVPVKTPWEQYLEALQVSGLAGSRLAESWRRAGGRALRDPALVEAPFLETGYFRGEDPAAVGCRIELKEGQVLKIGIELVPDSLLFFVDLFRLEIRDSTETLRHEFNAERYRIDSLAYEAEASGIYVLRLQPELLATCRYTLSLIVQPAYGHFPVSGKGNGDIWSFFGDPRDGGRREHHGVDIFAGRGTPVVAAVDGMVRSVRDGGLGGKQVWLYDSRRRQSLYYAHLDSQLVRQGARVRAGDTLGLVGNTGNARNTRPHLHFSIYRRGRGPVDPEPFIARRPAGLPRLAADPAWIGGLARVRTDNAALLAGPGSRSTVLATLDRHTPLRIIAASQRWFRVNTADGTGGYLAAASLEQASRSLEQLELDEPVELLERPHRQATPIGKVEARERLAVFARSGGFRLVRADGGPLGWMSRD